MQVASVRPRRRGAAALALASAVVMTMTGAACSSTSTSAAPGSTAGPAAGAGDATGTTAPARAAAAASTAAIPTVSGPVTGGKYGLPFNPVPKALAQQYGYSEAEYFVSGDATAYAPTGTLGADGHWSMNPTTSAPYETRILVRRPTDPAKFNGTVIVEWLNVSAGMDADPDFGFAHDQLMRNGFAYVGVSAQAVGINGGGVSLPIPGFDVQALKPWDPERYAPLHHPGDEYSYDIFSQAARAAVDSTSVKPLGDLRPAHMIAAGESQSAARMVSYVNAVQPLSKTFDGFLIHSRGPSGAAFGTDPSLAVPKVASIRDDVGVPVMQIETETDLFGLGYYPARQPDTKQLVTWEMAGTSHADQSTLDYGTESGHEWNPTATIDFTGLCGRINDGPQQFMVRAAIDSLARWVGGGAPPAAGTPFEVTDGQKLARDADGNVRGGIRNAAADVPTETLTGEADKAKSVICSLFGGSTPYPPEKLASLYPTHQAYVDAVTAATQKAVDAGHVLAADQTAIVDEAKAAKVPS